MLFSPRHAPSYRSRLEALVTLPLTVRPLLDNSIRDSLHLSGSLKTYLPSTRFSPFSKVTAHGNRSFSVILTLILIFYTQMPHQTLIRPKKGRLLVRSIPTPY